MRRILKLLAGFVLVVIIAAVVVAARGGTAQPETLTYDYVAPGPRSGDYAGFTVAFTNTGTTPLSNPQIRIVVDLGGHTWSCQGYVDPVSGEVVTGTDPVARPLVIPPGNTYNGTIYCRMPDVPLQAARMHLR